MYLTSCPQSAAEPCNINWEYWISLFCHDYLLRSKSFFFLTRPYTMYTEYRRSKKYLWFSRVTNWVERMEWKQILNMVHRFPLIASGFIIHLSQFWLCSKDYINIIITRIYIDNKFHLHSNFHNNVLILAHIINISTYSSRLPFCLVYMYIIKEESWEDWTSDAPKQKISKKNFKKKKSKFFLLLF